MNCHGDVIPCSPNTFDLGSPAVPFLEEYVGTIYVDRIYDDELLMDARIDNHFIILDDFNGWAQVLVGGATVDAPTRVTVFTGVVPNSSALRYSEIAPVHYGDAPASIDWDNKLIWLFSVVKINDDAEFVGRIQIKEGVPLGQLAADGLGLQIDNFNLSGETFGAGGRGVVPLVTVLNDAACYGIMIVHNPGVSDEFYVDAGAGWVLEGVQNNPALIPAGVAGNWNYMMVSGENGGVGGVNNELSLYKPYVLSYK